MRKHLNTLYVTTQGAYLAAEGETVLVKAEGDVKMRVPLHMLDSIVCFGNVLATPFLMGRCAEHAIGLAFLTENGRFLARVQGAVSGNVLLRREQYRWADDPRRSALVARAFVAAKVANSRRVLQRAVHDCGDSGGSLTMGVGALERTLAALNDAPSLDEVRGIEGDAAREYFAVFGELITTQRDDFKFQQRSRRPPLDAVNALLSFAYTLVMHDVESAVAAAGLDPQVGFLHRDRPGRPGLALDLMEEFRAFLADRLVLSLINRRQVKLGGFETRETGGVYMDEHTRKAVLVAYQERKQEELKHPFLDETTTAGMLPHIQATLLARYIRGDMDGYPAFFWR